jgi:soluble lytic murein transglycosylase-like protein
MPDDFNPLFEAATVRYGLPPYLLRELQRLETGESKNPVTAVGPMTDQGQALGLMQIMPDNISKLGGDPFKPADAIDMAARLSRDNIRMLRRYFPDKTDEEIERLAVATYHSGIGNVRRAGGVPNQPGVTKHMKKYDEIRSMRELNPLYAEGMAAGAAMPYPEPPPATQPEMAPPIPPSKDAPVSMRSLKFLMDLFNSVPQAPETYPSDTLRRMRGQ